MWRSVKRGYECGDLLTGGFECGDMLKGGYECGDLLKGEMSTEIC